MTTTGLKILNTISFIVMIVINMLANILPFNNISTGAVSDSYPNLFAPAAVTFSIWALIYILLACFLIYQFGSVGRKKDEIIKKIGPYFAISSFANAAWMFSWHYKNILLSIILMIVMFISLGVIFFRISNTSLSDKEKIFVKLSFSIYFGWISVALIANFIVLSISFGFNALSLAGQICTVIAILVGMVVGVFVIIREKNVFYGLVFVWAYIGILIKHLSSNGFGGRYLQIIITTCIAIALILVTEIVVIVKNKTLI